MNVRPPDYADSLLALTASILSYYGAETGHPTLPGLDSLLRKNYKNVVVMLFDGMGTAILEKHLPSDSFLRRRLRCSISSVFPPTTTAATITLESGLSPIQHGWLGWNLYFEEIGGSVSIFPNTLSGSDDVPASDYHVAGRYLPYRDIFTKITEATGRAVRTVRVSPFSDYRSRSVEEICHTVNALCHEDGRKYIYTYWHQPDYDMHDLGTSHEQIALDVAHINRQVEALCAGIEDTLVIITADHGLVDVEWRYIPDYPDIASCLDRPPSIESRALAFFVKPGMRDSFEKAFNGHFGGDYLLLTKERVLSEGWFGGGTPHPRAQGFIGDYLAVATGRITIECASSPQHEPFRAAHAGITPDETTVPFITVECI